MTALYLELVNRTNEVGVDINRAISHPHTANLVPFICGLGPRKGMALLKVEEHYHVVMGKASEVFVLGWVKCLFKTSDAQTDE